MSFSITFELERYIEENYGILHEYNRTTGIVKIACMNNHVWEANTDKVLSGAWCPHCKHSNREIAKRKSFELFKQIVSERGGKCLSETYVRNKIPLEVECANGHRWLAALHTIKKSWCPRCAREASRLTVEEMQNEAQARFGKFKSEKYLGLNEAHLWECKEGHEFLAKPMNVRAGTWCQICAKRAPVTIEQMHAIASERGGKCLSSEIQKLEDVLHWRCGVGHEWNTAAFNVRFGTWCPACAGRKKYNSPRVVEG